MFWRRPKSLSQLNARRPSSQSGRPGGARFSRLRVEQLEDRRLLFAGGIYWDVDPSGGSGVFAFFDDAIAVQEIAEQVYAVGTVYQGEALPGQTSAGAKDAFIQKLDSDGNVEWTRQFGTEHNDQAIEITIYGGDIYVLGRTEYLDDWTSGYNFVRCYTPAGVERWTTPFGYSEWDGELYRTLDADHIAVKGGDIYVSGRERVTGMGRGLGRVASHAPDGQDWGVSLVRASNDNPEVFNFSLHTSGRLKTDGEQLYVSGEARVPPPWGARLPGLATITAEEPYVGCDSAFQPVGSVMSFSGIIPEDFIVHGTSIYLVGLDGVQGHGLVSKMSLTGEVDWTRDLGPVYSSGTINPGAWNESLRLRIAADETGVYVSGQAEASGGGGGPYFVHKYAANGNDLWVSTHHASAYSTLTTGFSGLYGVKGTLVKIGNADHSWSNLPPTLDPIADRPAIAEDAGWRTFYLTGISAGPYERQELRITARSDNPGLLSDITINYTSGHSTGTLSYRPAPDQFGTADVTVTVRDAGWDGVFDTADDATVERTFAVVVDPVNDAPSFVGSEIPAVDANAGPQVLTNWVKSFSPGPDNESSQGVQAYSVTELSYPGLFFEAPAVARDGTLTYTPATNAYGTSTFKLAVQDDGGRDRGGIDTSSWQTFSITVNSPKNPLELAEIEPTPLPYTENDLAMPVTSAIAASNDSGGNLARAVIQITGNYQKGQDVLAFSNTKKIKGTWDARTGKLTLSGADTVANYQAALRAVKYRNTSNSPSSAERTVTFLVNDGKVNSNQVTRSIAVASVNDPPVLAKIDRPALVYTEKQPAKAISPSIAVSDADHPSLSGATVQITGNYQKGQDELLFANTLNITGAWNAQTGTMTLTGNDTVANYQKALRAVKFRTGSNPGTAVRTVTFLANDGSATSNALARNIAVKAVNDAPILAGIETTPLTYAKNQAPTAITASIIASDADNATLTRATVQITGGYKKGQDLLAFVNTATIVGRFNVNTGTLTLTGNDTLAAYQAALRSVTYQNTAATPGMNKRTVTFQVYDGRTYSKTRARAIQWSTSAAAVSTLASIQDARPAAKDAALVAMFPPRGCPELKCATCLDA